MGPDAYDNVLAAKPHELRHAQPGLNGEEQERTIPATHPCLVIRRGDEGVDLNAGKEGDRGPVVPLARDSQNALDQGALGDLGEGSVLEERVNCRKPDVTGPGADPALLLEVVEELADDGGVDILEGER